MLMDGFSGVDFLKKFFALAGGPRRAFGFGFCSKKMMFISFPVPPMTTWYAVRRVLLFDLAVSAFWSFRSSSTIAENTWVGGVIFNVIASVMISSRILEDDWIAAQCAETSIGIGSKVGSLLCPQTSDVLRESPRFWQSENDGLVLYICWSCFLASKNMVVGRPFGPVLAVVKMRSRRA